MRETSHAVSSPRRLPARGKIEKQNLAEQRRRAVSASAAFRTAESDGLLYLDRVLVSRRRHAALIASELRHDVKQMNKCESPKSRTHQTCRHSVVQSCSIQLTTISAEDALAVALPPKAQRLNLAEVFRLFEASLDVRFKSWENLTNTRFHSLLKEFILLMPCPPEKTISQMVEAMAIAESDPRPDRSSYLLGLYRPHSETVPLMPLPVWTHAATFAFGKKGRVSAANLLQALLRSTQVDVQLADGSILSCGQMRCSLRHPLSETSPQRASHPSNRDVASGDASGLAADDAGGPGVDIAIAAGGGCDVVTCIGWLAHVGAPEGSMVFHPGRPSSGIDTLISAVSDMEEVLTEPSQFYVGTDLVRRAQLIARNLSLGFRCFFVAQDKRLLATGSESDVVDHMNALIAGVASCAEDRAVRVRHVYVVDSGGDVLQAALAAGCPQHFDAEDFHSSIVPRAERDVWNLIVGLCVGERLGCKVSLVIVSPGVDAQSLWIGAPPAPEESASSIRRLPQRCSSLG